MSWPDRSRRLILEVGYTLLEFLHARTQRACEVGQALRAEENEDDDEDEQQFLIAQTEHGGTPFPC